jgi:ribosomal protein S21
MGMMENFARKDRVTFSVRHGDLGGAIKAWKATSKSLIADLRRREYPKASQRSKFKRALAAKRRKKIAALTPRGKRPWQSARQGGGVYGRVNP